MVDQMNWMAIINKTRFHRSFNSKNQIFPALANNFDIEPYYYKKNQCVEYIFVWGQKKWAGWLYQITLIHQELKPGLVYFTIAKHPMPTMLKIPLFFIIWTVIDFHLTNLLFRFQSLFWILQGHFLFGEWVLVANLYCILMQLLFSRPRLVCPSWPNEV